MFGAEGCRLASIVLLENTLTLSSVRTALVIDKCWRKIKRERERNTGLIIND